jgi:hypothetical protein
MAITSHTLERFTANWSSRISIDEYLWAILSLLQTLVDHCTRSDQLLILVAPGNQLNTCGCPVSILSIVWITVSCTSWPRTQVQ